jgi:hypothetical protein
LNRFLPANRCLMAYERALREETAEMMNSVAFQRCRA